MGIIINNTNFYIISEVGLFKLRVLPTSFDIKCNQQLFCLTRNQAIFDVSSFLQYTAVLHHQSQCKNEMRSRVEMTTRDNVKRQRLNSSRSSICHIKLQKVRTLFNAPQESESSHRINWLRKCCTGTAMTYTFAKYEHAAYIGCTCKTRIHDTSLCITIFEILSAKQTHQVLQEQKRKPLEEIT